MIGNPTSTGGKFYDSFFSNGPWKRLHISCLEHPNVIAGREIIKGAVTRGWVEEKRQEWGENHPFWFSRVIGEFPRISNRGVIPLAWVERAQNEPERQAALKAAHEQRIERVGGLDVARYGDNLSVLTVRHGDAVERIDSWHHYSLVETARRAKETIEEYKLSILVVDASGLGAGVADILISEGLPIFAYNGGHRAFTPSSFTNRRTELWWYLRERLEKGRLWLPAGSNEVRHLTADLVVPEYTIAPSGRIQVETKEKLLDRGMKSPDFADSLVMCFAMDAEPAELTPVPPSENKDPWIEREIEGEPDFAQLPEGF